MCVTLLILVFILVFKVFPLLPLLNFLPLCPSFHCSVLIHALSSSWNDTLHSHLYILVKTSPLFKTQLKLNSLKNLPPFRLSLPILSFEKLTLPLWNSQSRSPSILSSDIDIYIQWPFPCRNARPLSSSISLVSFLWPHKMELVPCTW